MISQAPTQSSNPTPSPTAPQVVPPPPNLNTPTAQQPPGTQPQQPAQQAQQPQPATTAQPLQPEYPKAPQQPLELKVQKNQPLSLNEAIEIAIQRSPNLLVSKLGVERSQGTVKEAEAGRLPTAGSSANYNYSESASSKLGGTGPSGFGGGGGGGGASSSLTGNIVRANWNLYTSGLVDARIDNAQQGLKFSTLDVEKALQDLKVGVANAYFDLQSQDGNVSIAESAVRNAEASLRDAEAQERAGVGTKFDVLRQQVQVANTQQRLLQAQNNRVVAQRNLARALNFEEPTNVIARDPIEESGSWDLSLEDSIFQAYAKRVELPEFVAQEQQAKAQERLAYAQLGPQLSLNAAVDFAKLFGNNADVPGQIGYSLGAQLQWNFFDGGAAQGQAQQAVAAAKIARVNFINTSNQVRFDVEQQFFTLESSKAQINSSRQAQTQAEEALRLARLRFRAGVGTQTEVISTEDALTQAKNNLLQAVISYNRSLAQLRRFIGIL
jgi:OMF family outer membrane factor